jgi:nucleoside 2-deoxyribosyltransferase
VLYSRKDVLAWSETRRFTSKVEESARQPSNQQDESIDRGGPRLYLAGKISKPDWREHVLGIPIRYIEPRDALDPSFELLMRGWRYGGPFFFSCSHGCTHGPVTHGLGPEAPCGESIWFDLAPDWQAAIKESREWPDRALKQRRDQVAETSLERIERADGVFAYINASDAYGTLVEIGHAAKLAKPLGIFFDKQLPSEVRDEMWLAATRANVSLRGTTLPAAFESFLSEAFPECRVVRPWHFPLKPNASQGDRS